MRDIDADTYLALAVDCLQKARYESEHRWMYVAIANAWVKLADHAEAENGSRSDLEADPEAEANIPALQ